jgi:hypothetical protein
MVTQMLAKKGDFWDLVQQIRAQWRLDKADRRLPPNSEGILYPANLRYVEFRDRPAEALTYPSCTEDPKLVCEGNCTPCRNRRRLWQSELEWILFGGKAGEYLEGWVPSVDEPGDYFDDYPPVPKHQIALLRFAAACLLYDVPPVEADEFIDVGGVRSLRGGAEGESWLGVAGPSQLRDQAISAAEREAYDKLLRDKVWALRSELGNDPEQAKLEVGRRFFEELEAEGDRARKAEELWLESNPPRKYLIEYDPEVDTEDDIKRITDAIDAEHGLSPEGKKGRRDQGAFRRVQFARLLEEGWTTRRVATQFNYKESTVKRYARQGAKMIKGDL